MVFVYLRNQCTSILSIHCKVLAVHLRSDRQYFVALSSLPNVSNQVRWSLDLRWQRPDQPYGLFGLKDGMPVRSAKDPSVKAGLGEVRVCRQDFSAAEVSRRTGKGGFP